MIFVPDEFLSEEDLDVRTMSDEELYTYWNFWFQQAQSTNAYDRHIYSHGVFAGAEELNPNPLWPEGNQASVDDSFIP